MCYMNDVPTVTPISSKDFDRDRLNNVLTGITLKSGLLQTKVLDKRIRGELRELEELAIQAVMLIRQL